MLIEIVKLIFYLLLIVIISKYLLVTIIRNIALNFNLKSETIGNITGVATSLPEFFIVCLSSFLGLATTTIFNILSSNIINFIQYVWTIIVNKNIQILNNKALKIAIAIVIITILIPIYILVYDVKFTIPLAVFLIVLFIFFYKINDNAYKFYFNDVSSDNQKGKSSNNKKINVILIIKYVVYLILVAILLFIVGQRLGNTLEILCYTLKFPEYIVGIILGFGSSIPEVITFFEAQKYEKNIENKKLGVIEATNNLLISNMLNIFIIQAIGVFLISV